MRTAAGLAVTIAIVVVLGEAAMKPSPQERVTLYTVFAGAALLAALVGWWLTRRHRHLRSLRWTVLVVAVAAVVTAGAVVAGSVLAMVLAPADARLVLAALTLGTGLGVLVAVGITGPLTADLRDLAATAGRVADGDLTVRSSIVRNDEVGALARSVDRMVAQLADLDADRRRGEEARRHLLAAIGHDLRTPMASLQAAVEALEDGVAADPARYLRSMVRDIELLHGMVEDLFDLARLEAGDLSLEWLRIDLAELAEGAAEAVAPLAARQGVSVEVVAPDGVPVRADPQAVNRVLRNLLDNAIRHAPSGTVVTVAVDRTATGAILRVRDHGPGFPPEFVQRAFEPFSRPDDARGRQGGGAGLGLAIARQLVEAHGGAIRIEDGPGSSLALHLPAAEPTS